jgi:hypothetical protein
LKRAKLVVAKLINAVEDLGPLFKINKELSKL